jgi:RNA polymerase sigma factor (sigma-70 family)
MPTDSAALRLLPHLRRVALGRDTETGDGHLLGLFVSTRDEAAFAALVRRHGPMVLGVCRRVIGDPHLAEDAFQATFLVLARRAASVRPRHLVGHWLYGVAYRTALKARGVAVRRMAKEKQVDAMPHPPVPPDEAWADLQPVLDAELARLPDKYRIPVVLCDLGGRTQRDVARELRLPPATLANRLAAARRLLAKRLTQRGVALSGGAVAAALGWHAATSAVPPSLAASTVKAACAAAAGTAVGLPAPVVQLSDGVLRMFVLNKLKAVATGVVTGLAILAGLGLMAGPSVWAGPEEKPNRPTPAPAPAAKPADPQRPPDDLVFLRRTSLDLRGTLPTRLEAHYFLADTDPKKRAKIVEWMLPEHGKQKATENCLKCHKLPEGVPFLKDIPHLGRLFTKPGDPHHSGHFTGDFDDDGIVDVFVANQLRGATAGESNNQAIAVRRAEMEAARIQVEAARKKIDEIKHVTVPDSPVAKDLLGRAQADLTKAEAVYRAAEQRWKDATDHADYWRLRATFRQANQDRITQGLDRLLIEQWLTAKPPPTDAEFLRRVVLDLTGFPPTTVEERYFVADKDPKKREKLLGLLLGKGDKPTARDQLIDDLLADPEVQRRWAELTQRRLYAEQVNAAREAWTNKPAGRLDRLLADLLERKKSDEQVLNALCLATLARFPTETEQKLILDAVKAQTDRRAAWQGVLKALAATEEAKAHAAELGKRGAK